MPNRNRLSDIYLAFSLCPIVDLSVDNYYHFCLFYLFFVNVQIDERVSVALNCCKLIRLIGTENQVFI